MIGFVVTGSYALYNAYIYSKLKYKDKEKVLFLEGKLVNEEKLIERIKKLGLFKDVILLKEEEDIEKNAGLYEEMKVLHVFAAWHFTEMLYKRLNCKIIISEEGLYTYMLEEVNTFLNDGNFDEIWINKINMYSGHKFKDKLKEVKTTDLIRDKNFETFLNELNYIFNYDEVNEEEVESLYIDQYFSFEEKASYEELYFWKELKPYLEYYKVYVKKHPSVPHEEKFTEYKYMMNIDTLVPIELIFLNRVREGEKKKSTIICLISSCPFTLKILFDEYFDFNFLFLYELLIYKKYDNIVRIFSGNELNDVSVIKSFLELDDKLSAIKKVKSFNKLTNSNKSEWLAEKNKIAINNIYMKSELNLSEFNYYMGIIIFLEDIYEKIKDEKKIFIWGAAKLGLCFAEILDMYNIYYEFIDTFKEGMLNGRKINKYENIELTSDKYIVISTYPGRESIKSELIKAGKVEIKDYISLL